MFCTFSFDMLVHLHVNVDYISISVKFLIYLIDITLCSLACLFWNKKKKAFNDVICIQVFSTTEVSVFSSNGLDNTTSFTYRRIGVCLIMVPFKSHSSQRLLIVLRTSNINNWNPFFDNQCRVFMLTGRTCHDSKI